MSAALKVYIISLSSLLLLEQVLMPCLAETSDVLTSDFESICNAEDFRMMFGFIKQRISHSQQNSFPIV